MPEFIDINSITLVIAVNLCAILGKLYPKSLYGLVYMFFLSYCCSITLFALIKYYPSVFDHTLTAAIKSLALWYIDVSVGWREELALVGFLSFIVLIPQFMSYVISGIFGAASPPSFVKSTFDISIILLAKFCAVYAAISASILTIHIYSGDIVHDAPQGLNIFASHVLVSISVSLVLYYHGANYYLASLNSTLFGGIFSIINKFMTRNVPDHEVGD